MGSESPGRAESLDGFTLAAASDGMSAVIQEGSLLPHSILSWSITDAIGMARAQGFKVDPLQKDLDALQKKLRDNPPGTPLAEDFIFLRGIAPRDAQPGRLQWLNPENQPKDLVTRGKTFLKIFDPLPHFDGKDVFGNPVAATGRQEFGVIRLQLANEFRIHTDRSIEPLISGQATLNGLELLFSKEYEVENPTLPEYQNTEFFCDVLVRKDLVGTMKWRVHGKLHVEGHWSASNLEVYGDVQADSGIQTNMVGALKFFGNCQVNFIQMSRIGIAGNLTVLNSVLQSEVRVGGDLACRSGPGALMGSTIHVFGVLDAIRVGSDRGRSTKIEIFKNPMGKKSRIRILNKGTQMRVFKRTWIVKDDGPYETPDPN